MDVRCRKNQTHSGDRGDQIFDVEITNKIFSYFRAYFVIPGKRVAVCHPLSMHVAVSIPCSAPLFVK
jgi:hypothetical protein